MRLSFRSVPRRLLTAAALPVLALGLSLGHAPQAAAEMGSGSAEFEIVVHKNDTIDLKYTASIEGVNPSLYCTDEALKESTTIPNAKAEIVGNTCTVKATSVPLETLNNETTTLKHEGKKYVYRAKSGPGNLSQQSSFKFTISMTFPGKVQKADGGGEIKGNKVTWTNPPEEGFGAEASDGSSSVMIWVLLGLVVLLVIVAVVVILVVVSKRKKPTPPAGMYPQPGAPQPQPGYGAGQPVAGTPYVQPQAYQQPGYSQPQGGQAPGQPYQQPGYSQPQGGQAPGQPYQQPGYSQPQGGQAPGSSGYGY